MVNNHFAPEKIEKELSFASILTGIYIIIWYLGVGNRIPVLGAIRIEFILGFILFVLSAISIAGHKKTDSDNLVSVAIILLIILGLYTVFSYDRDTSITIYIDRVVKFAMLSLFIAAFCRTLTALKFFIFCLLIAWLKMGSEGFIGWYSGSLVWENQGIPRLHGPTGATAHPNSFSGFAVGTLPFIFYLFPLSKKFWQKSILLVMGIFAAVIIISTGSRTGYVATSFFLLYFGYELKVSKFKILILLVLVTFLASPFIDDSYKDRFASIFTQEEAEGHSSETRLIILEDAWEIYKSYPLGVGVEAFPAVRIDMFGRFQDTHNLYLQILTNTGPLGFWCFILLIMKIINLNKKNILKNLNYISDFKKNESLAIDSSENKVIKEKEFLIAISKAIIGFIIIRLFLGLFGMDLYEIYWWLAIGLTLSVNTITNHKCSIDYCEK